MYVKFHVRVMCYIFHFTMRKRFKPQEKLYTHGIEYNSWKYWKYDNISKCHRNNITI